MHENVVVEKGTALKEILSLVIPKRMEEGVKEVDSLEVTGTTRRAGGKGKTCQRKMSPLQWRADREGGRIWQTAGARCCRLKESVFVRS